MGFSKPPGVPCPPNNPHCQGDVPSVTIQSDMLTIILVLAIFVYVLWIFYRKPKELTNQEMEENLKWKLFFISMQDRWIFRPNDFYKEYFKKDGELKNKYKNINHE